MTKVYMLSYETMCLDLLNNNVKEEDIEEFVEEILGELRLINIIENDDSYVVGNLTAFLLKEKFGIECTEIQLI
ncbi:hypothetical protein G9F71_008505 [Clostridium sp. FP2]|uniref:hypothetical protein n=1 Tax=Clostridium sp. FP2 TaxID=2724481 RepID=UPI0013E98198|nr:hypothetical protein [Clostridium sp. FP2]MBZ9622893.1 hypothetical protein [Clostridium sp. FP2]